MSLNNVTDIILIFYIALVFNPDKLWERSP